MPLYEYRCTKCGHEIEVLQKFSDRPKRRCSECSGKLEKLISRASFQLKGGGWYAQGYGANGGKGSGANGGKGSGANGGKGSGSSGGKGSGSSGSASSSGSSSSGGSSSSSSKSDSGSGSKASAATA